MSCSTNSKGTKERKNFEKLKLKNIIVYIRLFDCRCTSSNTSNLCLRPLETNNFSLTDLIWTITPSTETTETTPDMIRSSDVLWGYVCFNIMKTDDSKVTWLVILGANPLLFSFWLAPGWTKIRMCGGRGLPFWCAPIQLKSDVRRYVNSLLTFSSKDRWKPVQCRWGAFVSEIMISFLFSFLTFPFGKILFII